MGSLKGHKESHLPRNPNDKPFKCDQCEKTFHTNANLKSHIGYAHKKKKSDKVRICDLCGASVLAHRFKHHMTHKHRDQKFKCEKCDLTFSHVPTYNQHYKQRHTFVTCEER